MLLNLHHVRKIDRVIGKAGNVKHQKVFMSSPQVHLKFTHSLRGQVRDYPARKSM